MGNAGVNAGSKEIPENITRNLFEFKYIIGKGGFGKVWKVQVKKTKQKFAMKEMCKLRIVTKRSVHSVLNEKKLLSVLKHPFIVNMQYAFQDRENLFLVMDLMTGGDLRYHLGNMRFFDEEQTRFFVACIVTGLEYLHINHIIHRDIKPENLVLDNKGYLRITDFGIARVLSSDNSRDTSGTPGYMAPEVMCRQNHGIGVDYFALGVLVYEFMTGRRPWRGRNRKEIKDSILGRQVQLKRSDIPEGWSIEAADFVNKLLQRKPQNRLGFNGALEVKNHAWLADFPWKRLFEKALEAPYKPSEDENFEVKANADWKDDLECSLRMSSIQEYFKEYYFDRRKKVTKEDQSTVMVRQNRPQSPI